jgi:hypothetical protein
MSLLAAKRTSCAVFILLAMTGWGSPARAQVPGGGGEAVCQLITDGFVSEQSGGIFPVGPASCEIGPQPEDAPGTSAEIAIQPFVKLGAKAEADFGEAADRSGATALAALQYDFRLTGGNPGDLVPILVHTSLHTNVTESQDFNNSNVASANIVVSSLSSPGNFASTFACSVSPGDCGGDPDVEEDLALTMASGSAGRVFMQILVSASSTSGGSAGGDIDPFIFVDPHFANAADYTITVASGVANALPPVPEPGGWALMLAGLGGLSAIVRRRRRT